MLTVAIYDLRVWAYVGMYEEERKIPNELSVSVSVQVAADLEDIPYIDYTRLHQIIINAVQGFHYLLEDVIREIRKEILVLTDFSGLEISLKKLHPPTGSDLHSSLVRWSEKGNLP